MNPSYQLLFRINFFHTYFQNGELRNLQVKADSLSERVFINYDLIFRKEVNGIGIYYAEQFADRGRTRNEILAENLQFNFKLSCNDENILNYTDDVPLIIKDSLFYFEYPLIAKNAESGLLHSNMYANKNDLKSNVQLEQPYFSKPFGHIKINIDQQIPTDLTVRFKAPELYWRYVIHAAHLMEFEGLAVANKNKTIFFSGPQSIQLPNGKIAIAFTSPAAIVFKEIPDITWQLLVQFKLGENLGRVMMPNLPVPKNNQVSFLGKQYAMENEKRVLEIFI